uniref:Limbic system associated membrane protein n=1 Tax=Taeniopygia guttata TaxID=59729 RepID=A0A674GF75_TAEGU|nr:limbic system-associated membrane protein isoform X2 [Taeniopygia guttata]
MLLCKSAGVWLQAAKPSCLHFWPQTHFPQYFILRILAVPSSVLYALLPVPPSHSASPGCSCLLSASRSSSPLPFSSFLQPPHSIPFPLSLLPSPSGLTPSVLQPSRLSKPPLPAAVPPPRPGRRPVSPRAAPVPGAEPRAALPAGERWERGPAPSAPAAAAVVPSCRLTRLPVRSVDFTRGTDNITVRQGDTAILRCYVEDRSSKVAWLNRSGIIFAGEDKWSLDPRVELEKRNPLEYSLRIQKVDVYDEGSYTCSVQTQHHPKTSQVYLIVQVPPKISNISSDITVNEGSNVTLVCMANGRPEPVITWRHLTPTGREFEGEEEYLEILGITREQSGKYECKAANEVASADVKQVRVTVNYPPTITESKSNEAATGRQALLRCEASAVPTPDFEWYRDDTRINSANGLEIKSTGSQSLLMVANVTEEHYGNYTCVAANKLGVTNASLYLYRPGTGRVDNGSMSLAVPLWLLAASLLCLLSKC